MRISHSQRENADRPGMPEVVVSIKPTPADMVNAFWGPHRCARDNAEFFKRASAAMRSRMTPEYVKSQCVEIGAALAGDKDTFDWLWLICMSAVHSKPQDLISCD